MNETVDETDEEIVRHLGSIQAQSSLWITDSTRLLSLMASGQDWATIISYLLGRSSLYGNDYKLQSPEGRHALIEFSREFTPVRWMNVRAEGRLNKFLEILARNNATGFRNAIQHERSSHWQGVNPCRSITLGQWSEALTENTTQEDAWL